MTLLQEALALAATGIPVFPCKEDKRPACEHGFKDASTDPAVIRKLFSAPNAVRIGYPTGAASGVDVLDIDIDKGGDRWERLAGLDKITMVCETRSGGKHYLFRHAPGVESTQSKLAIGVDTRGDKGYAISYPTIVDREVADWPADILETLTTPRVRTPRENYISKLTSIATPESSKLALKLARKQIKDCPEGKLHETVRDLCMSIASLVLGELLEEDEAHDAIIEAADEAGARDMDNVENSWTSAMEKASPAEPNTGDELGPLPDLDEQDDFDPSTWRDYLTRGKPDKDGNPGPIKANTANASRAFLLSPKYRNRVRANRFSGRIEMDGETLNDDHLVSAVVWAQDEGIPLSKETVKDGLRHASTRNAYHPVQDMLRALVWDGESRLDTWLIIYAGAEDTPLNRAFARKFLISLVARPLRPGCKVDTALILEGPQAMGKSTLFRVLCGNPLWFMGSLGDVNDKNTLEKIQGKWMVEQSEMSHMRLGDVSSFKAFMSTEIDTFRPSYGAYPSDYPRQCVFGGTVNPGATGYLKDETGARRFWPVLCGVGWDENRKIDALGLAAVRDQLLAEAVVAFIAGEKWYLETESLETLQRAAASERYEVDPWEQPIAEFLTDKQMTTIQDILLKAIRLDTKDHNQRNATGIGKILTRLGWVAKTVRFGARTERRYVSPEWLATGGACNVVPIRQTTLADLSA